PDYCDRLLPGGPIPRPDWISKQLPPSDADEQKPSGVTEFYPAGHWYDGFPLVEETRTDGWCYGAVTEFNEPECHPNGCESGNGFVETPDGARIGLVWSTRAFAAKWAPSLSE